MKNNSEDKIIEISSIEELLEISTAGGAAPSIEGAPMNKKEEKIIREYIRRKIKKIHARKMNEQMKQENELRKIIRTLLKEGDISDIHPHRSTAINVLEDVLKKAVPTLRTDYKRLTTNTEQRESFRAHMLKAIKDALAPSLVNWKYLSGQEGDGGLLSEPPSEDVKAAAADEPIKKTGGSELDDLEKELQSLEEADVNVDIADDDEPDEAKKVPVEDDDTPDEKEEFGAGLEDMDETGRNMAYTSHRKISQYVLDAYDLLSNGQDKEVFVDYLLTNLKLYFDKFEGELQKSVQEPESIDYKKAAE
tara:strand:- start:985 stop:1902 length:918 start_codon:yes stop_codon:yes gene_type:complete